MSWDGVKDSRWMTRWPMCMCFLLMSQWIQARSVWDAAVTATELVNAARNKYYASLCSATYVQWQRDTARIRYLLPPGPQQQTCSSGVRRPDGTDRQTDGRTDARQLHRLCSTYYAGSVNNGPLYPASLPSKPLLAISAGHCARLYLLTC